MPRPVLLAVDDDPDVLRDVERDLRKQYSDRYRVMSADSGPAALSILTRLAQRAEPVALLIADHRMPRMNGIEFLTAAIREFPDVRHVLLTAYADPEAAIGAINLVKLDHYLLKPWDPPDRNLYPVLDDLLDQWSASYRPPFEGFRVIGTRWSRHFNSSRAIKAVIRYCPDSAWFVAVPTRDTFPHPSLIRPIGACQTSRPANLPQNVERVISVVDKVNATPVEGDRETEQSAGAVA
jgi:CheY-like chemotaxis protein